MKKPRFLQAQEGGIAKKQLMGSWVKLKAACVWVDMAKNSAKRVFWQKLKAAQKWAGIAKSGASKGEYN